VRQSQLTEAGTVVRTQTQSNQTADRLSRAEQPREADKDRTLRAGSVSRFSRMMGSVTGRTSRSMSRADEGIRSERGSIYDASLVSDGRRDSAEEMRKEMLRQEQEGLGEGLENIRACCGGKCLDLLAVVRC
jgi:hypothetical protein